jgi:hypothetical protein
MNTITMLSQLRSSRLQGTAPTLLKVTRIRVMQLFTTVLVAMMLFAGLPAAFGQAQNTGSIWGTAVDASGAIIPNATVTLKGASTGFSRTVTTSSAGEYLLQSIPVGKYILTVTAPTFQAYKVTDVVVDADSNTKIVAKLAAGEATDTVTVEESGTTVDSRSATLGTLIDNKLVEDIPIDGRNVVAMAGLLPGVTEVNAPTTATGDTKGPTYSVAGSRTTQNLMLFDGLMWNNLFANTGINYPPPNALQEISILLNNYKAQYGRNAGSVFNVLTRTGTNTVHGAVWDYVHNQMFDAQDYLNPLPSGKAPEDNIQQFGFTVGGPIIKDKIYYFGAFQQIIMRLQALGKQTPNPPTYADRGYLNNSPNVLSAATQTTPAYDRPCSTPGPFAGLMCASFLTEVQHAKFLNPEAADGTSSSGASGSDADAMFASAYTQETGLPGSTNPCFALLAAASTWAAGHYYPDSGIVPVNNVAAPIDPLTGLTEKAQPTYMPYAEVPTACLNPVMARIQAVYMPLSSVTVASQPRFDSNGLARIDWNLNDKHHIDARYDLILANDRTAPGVGSNSAGVAGYAIDYNTATSNFGNIGDTWVVTPSIVNTIRLGYKRYVNEVTPTEHRTLNSFKGNLVEPGMPTMPAISFSGYYGLGATSQAYSIKVNEDIELLEQLSWSRGKHNYQFGVNFLRLQYQNSADYPGSLPFSSTFTGNSFGDASMGLLTTVTANSRLVQGGVQHDAFFYAQDDWRATPRLTLNLGVRYELPFQWYQPTGYSSTFIPGHQSTVFPNAIGGLAFPGDPGVLKSLVPTDFNGLVPRVGFAYDVFGTGRFSIRGGFGMFFDAINANVIGVGEPFYYQITQNLPQGGFSNPLAGYSALPTGYDKSNPTFRAPYTNFFPDRNFRTPYLMAANFGFEYKVPHGGTLGMNYVGRFGRKMTVPFDLNPAIYDCTGGYFQADPTKYCSGASSSPSSTRARLRYTPFNYGGTGLVDFASIGTSSYNGLQVQYTQRGGKLLTILTSYAYAKSTDLSSDGTSTKNAIPNVFNVSSDYGLSNGDATHIFTLGWALNSPRIVRGYSPVRSVLNHWTFSGTYNARTGQPFSVTINSDTALVAEPGERAEIVPGMNPSLPSNRHRADKVAQWFNVNAFTYPLPGTFSSVRRNNFRGPGYIMTNMGLGRAFPLRQIRQDMRLQFRAEALNVFNTPNLAQPGGGFSCSNSSISSGGLSPCAIGKNLGVYNLTSKTFGVVGSTYGTNASTSSNGRKMQFSLTLYY